MIALAMACILTLYAESCIASASRRAERSLSRSAAFWFEFIASRIMSNCACSEFDSIVLMRSAARAFSSATAAATRALASASETTDCPLTPPTTVDKSS